MIGIVSIKWEEDSWLATGPPHELRHARLVVHGGKEEDLDALLLENLHRWRVGDGLRVVTRGVVDHRLLLEHARNVPVERSRLLLVGFQRVRRVEAEELRNLAAVRIVLEAPVTDVRCEGLPEVRVGAVALLFGFSLAILLLFLLLVLIRELVELALFAEKLQHLPDALLPNHLKDLVLLELLAVNFQGQVIRVNDTLHEVKPLREDVRILPLSDHDTADVELDAVRATFFLVTHLGEGASSRDVEQRGELDFTLRREMRLHQRRRGRVVRQRLEEGDVVALLNLFLRLEPQRLVAVDLLPLVLHLRRAFLFVVVELLVILVILLLHAELDRELHELTVLLDARLEVSDFQERRRLLLHVESDAAPAAQGRSAGVLGHREASVGPGLPDVLDRLIVGDRRHRHLVRNQKRGVETHPELAVQRRVRALLQRFQEVVGTGLSDRTQVRDELLLRHPNTGILDGQRLRGGVSLDTDLEVRILAEVLRVLDGKEPSLLQGVHGVRDELTQINTLVDVQRVDDDVHQTLSLRPEVVVFGVLGHLIPHLLTQTVDQDLRA